MTNITPATVEAEVERLRNLLSDALAYVQHDADCSWQQRPVCDCGLAELGERMLRAVERGEGEE